MKKLPVFLLFLIWQPLLAQTPQGPASPLEAASLEVQVERLRNTSGLIHVCLTRQTDHFPDCTNDPQAIRTTVPADIQTIRFVDFTPGRYALTLFHDENLNRRLDKILGIPREGFGFSRNPAIGFGAPKFGQVDIELRPGLTRHTVRVQYVL